jgi:hypothetical protein
MMITAKEELLIDRCFKKDPGALRLLLEEYGRPVYGFCVSFFSGDCRFAEPLFYKAFSSFLRSPGLSELRTPLLIQLLSFVVRELYGSFGPLKPDAPQGCVPAPETLKSLWPETDLLFRKRLAVILKAFAGMAAEEKAALLLRDQMDLEYPEIAKLLGMNEKKVHQVLLRSRIRLGEHVDSLMRAGRQ